MRLACQPLSCHPDGSGLTYASFKPCYKTLRYHIGGAVRNLKLWAGVLVGLVVLLAGGAWGYEPPRIIGTLI